MGSKWMAVATAVLCAGIAGTAFADTQLTLTGTGSTTEPISSGESAYIYPYEFTVVSGASTQTDVDLMCISFDQEITVGESWTTTVTQLSSNSSDFDKEEAYLFSLIDTSGSNTDAEIQFADWYLSDSHNPNEVTETPFYQSNSTAIMNYVYEAETVGLTQSNSFYNDFEIYTPSGSFPSNEYPYGMPQTFIGDAPPSATPEPGSLALLGTGLLGLGGVVRRRLQK